MSLALDVYASAARLSPSRGKAYDNIARAAAKSAAKAVNAYTASDTSSDAPALPRAPDTAFLVSAVRGGSRVSPAGRAPLVTATSKLIPHLSIQPCSSLPLAASLRRSSSPRRMSRQVASPSASVMTAPPEFMNFNACIRSSQRPQEHTRNYRRAGLREPRTQQATVAQAVGGGARAGCVVPRA
ncbi:uncharacterized protein SCHCODRAFT_01219231 [Schizophyllum commune H4-8]|uniref:uncharacterized protein n=1 Tax=Schizophyllum commune (strain H4-8 / FGSC 9210) TaxID=578458 RepID=UPI0021608C5D|nr:uncharacterized protein SCHCODRAFT_01219231 [Schizophyllum commune H4-8]KAI5893135.1 hypothetical protein SCHCODRAFT_01219231 [Schizophyllum commune H4-8]